ncbi:MAG: nucleotide exchange factor GrpE [Candidatus Acidiferrales bacterium]
MNGRDDKQDANLNDEEGLVSEESSSAGTSGAQAEDLAKLQAEKDALAETLVRRQADFENYRKRIERERAEEGRRAQSRLIEDLLPVLDGFERALSAHDDPAYEEYRKGLEIIYKQLWDTLARHGLERIEAAGKPFDPHVHQAIDRVETHEHPDGTVVDVLQQGYRIHERVLRPSAVRVAVHPAADAPGGRLHSAKKAN